MFFLFSLLSIEKHLIQTNNLISIQQIQLFIKLPLSKFLHTDLSLIVIKGIFFQTEKNRLSNDLAHNDYPMCEVERLIKEY